MSSWIIHTYIGLTTYFELVIFLQSLTDEFDGDVLDATKWDAMHPHWFGRAPSRYKRENTFVKDGKLHLRSGVLKDPNTVEDPEDRWVSSAVCVSMQNSAKAGYYYEARIKASDLSRSSAFWFRAGKFSEIDVIEHIGHPSNPISETLGKDLSYQYHANAFHYRAGSKTIQVNEDEWFMPTRGRDEYHVYGLWWKNPNVLLFYHNDTKVMTLPTPTPFNEDLKMLFDTVSFPAFYGPWGRLGLPKVENLRDNSKNTMTVDWVRTYNLASDERNVACSGVVTCTDTGRRLKDVQVRVLETGQSVLTDVQGRFYVFTGKQGPQTLVFDKPGFMVAEKTVTGVQNTIEMTLRPRKMSAASFRWLNYIESETAYNKLDYRPNRFWKVEFKQSDLGEDFASDPRFVRRDPSAVITGEWRIVRGQWRYALFRTIYFCSAQYG